MPRERRQRPLRVEPASQHVRRAPRQPQQQVAETPRVEQRSGHDLGVTEPERDPVEHRTDALDRARVAAAGRSFRTARGAARQDHHGARLGRWRHRARACELGERRLVDQQRTAVGDGVGELVVVDHRADALAVDHVGELRPGEPRVEQHEVGTGRRHARHRLDETDVVPCEQPDPITGPDTARGETGGDRLRPPPELAIRGTARVVDDRRTVGIAGGTAGHQAGHRRPPRRHRRERPRQPIGSLERRERRAGDRRPRLDLRPERHQGRNSG